MRRALFSVMAVSLVALLAGAGGLAYMTDTETSEGNTIEAGTLDLKVDVESTASYADDPIEFPEKDLDSPPQLFFNWKDVKPGDSGEATISLHSKTNDAYITMKVGNIESTEESVTEPEKEAETGDRWATGELAQHLYLRIWSDMGQEGFGDDLEGNNEYDETYEEMLWQGYADKLPEKFDGWMMGCENYYIGFSWEVDLKVGNEIQTDKVTFDIQFEVSQKRHQSTNPFPHTEQLYLADSRPEDGTDLFKVDLVDNPDNPDNAELTHLYTLPADKGYNQTDAIACTTDGENIYVIDKRSDNLGRYDVLTGDFTNLGEISDCPGDVVSAAISLDGTLYIESNSEKALYEIENRNLDPEADHVNDVNVRGITDIAFDSDGKLYLYSPDHGGLYKMNSATDSNVQHIGDPDLYKTGLAVRDAGFGPLVGSDRSANDIVVVDQTDANIINSYQMTLNGNPYKYDYGDMTVGELVDP